MEIALYWTSQGHVVRCDQCRANYTSDGESDGPEDLFTHMVRKHIKFSDIEGPIHLIYLGEIYLGEVR